MPIKAGLSQRKRNDSESIACILNPNAQGGRAGRGADRLRRALDQAFGEWELLLTEGPGHASELTRDALNSGAKIVAAVGGDGTCHEVVNGFFSDGKPVRPGSAFSLVPWGTGSDLARSVKAPKNIEDALWVAACGMTVPSDVGVAHFKDHEGKDASRLFINSAGFGCNGEVASRANASSKRLGGTVTFLGATFATLASFKAPKLSMEWESSEGKGAWEGPFMSAFLMNGSYCGGGMNLAPRGSMHDGHLDLTVLPEMGFVGAVAKSWRLFDGSAEKVSGVRVGLVEELRAEAPNGEQVLIELDGEQPGRLPLRARVMKGALPVRGGWLTSPASLKM